MIPGAPTPMFFGNTQVELNFLSKEYLYSGVNNPSIAGVSLGPAQGDRTIIMACHAGWDGGTAGALHTAATIGGVSANLLAAQAANYVGDYTSALFIARVPSGTTGTITATLSGVKYAHYFALWSVTGLSTITPYDLQTNNVQIGNTSTQGIGLDIPAGGCAVAFGSYRANGIGSGTMTGVSTDFSDPPPNANNLFVGGSFSAAINYTNRRIFVATPAGLSTAARNTMIGASFI